MKVQQKKNTVVPIQEGGFTFYLPTIKLGAIYKPIFKHGRVVKFRDRSQAMQYFYT